MTDRRREPFPALPLAEGLDTSQLTDLGSVTIRGDLRSYRWDGQSTLEGGVDSTATDGYLLDSSEGSAQFEGGMFVGGGIRVFDGNLSVEKGLLVLNPQTVSIVSGVAAITRSHVALVEEGGAADDLVSLSGGASLGAIVVLRRDSASTNTITVKDGTGNLALNGDFAMDSTDDTIVLMRLLAGWVELARSSNA